MQPTLLVSACDFGWGSVGKLRLILDHLPGTRVALDGTGVQDTAVSLMGSRHRFVTLGDRSAATVALVINDPRAADEITEAGVPVVYVDSLPYLWTTEYEVPRKVAVYCVQRSPLPTLPATTPLSGRADLRWVDPIVPTPQRRSGGAGVVVNVGGLHSHLVGAAADAYLRLVVVPLVRALIAADRPIAAVCGNLPRWAIDELTDLLPSGVRIGLVTTYDFQRVLRTADLLFTSPGSTTILQAAGMRMPMALLPPQNLSQILNAEIYRVPGQVVVSWPDSMLSRAEVDALRPRGEDAVLRYVYSAIEAAQRSASMASAVADVLNAAVRDAGAAMPTLDLTRLGTGGAQQVARVLRQALFAPLPTPVRGER